MFDVLLCVCAPRSDTQAAGRMQSLIVTGITLVQVYIETSTVIWACGSSSECGARAMQVFFYICVINNTFICVLLFLGAGSVFNAATGMSIYACCL